MSLRAPAYGVGTPVVDKISFVIPAYNEMKRLPGTLWALKAGFTGSDFEIIVVDDGSRDRTASIAADHHAKLVRHERNRGKGAALASGMSTVTGGVIVFLDADLPSPVDEIMRVIGHLLESGCDVVFGSRRAPGARVRRSPFKNIVGQIYNILARIVLGTDLQDTQCGVKAITAKAAFIILPMLTETGFAIDVDLLMAARQTGLEVRELGIEWEDRPGSTVHLFRDTVRMTRALFRLRRKYREFAVPDVVGVRA